jgi:hypothetical protein
MMIIPTFAMICELSPQDKTDPNYAYCALPRSKQTQAHYVFVSSKLLQSFGIVCMM